MVDKILAIKTTADFTFVSCELLKKEAKTALYDSMASSGILMLNEDAWTPEELDTIAKYPQRLEEAIARTEGEDDSAKLLHRLQLIGRCNPGISKYIQQVLQRACV